MTQSNILSMTESTPNRAGALAQSDASKKVSEIQAAMIVAKRFPRDQTIAYNNILQSCKRKSLAEVSTYQYPRSGSTVKGPSIRMAEMLAQQWGNMEFGVREIDRTGNESTVEAFAWDLETNVKRSMQFQVRHVRDTKKGAKKLSDQRDIYEMIANQGARRLRACILNVIPGDITESALEACYKTLAGGSSEPLKDRARKMVSAFSDHGITHEMICDRLGHALDKITEAQLHELRGIFTSIKDGQTSREDWFEVSKPKSKKQEPDDDGSEEFGPTPKAKRRRSSKPKHDDMHSDEEPKEIAALKELCKDDLERMRQYAIEQEWIAEGDDLETIKPAFAKGIVEQGYAFLETLKNWKGQKA